MATKPEVQQILFKTNWEKKVKEITDGASTIQKSMYDAFRIDDASQKGLARYLNFTEKIKDSLSGLGAEEMSMLPKKDQTAIQKLSTQLITDQEKLAEEYDRQATYKKIGDDIFEIQQKLKKEGLGEKEVYDLNNQISKLQTKQSEFGVSLLDVGEFDKMAVNAEKAQKKIETITKPLKEQLEIQKKVNAAYKKAGVITKAEAAAMKKKKKDVEVAMKKDGIGFLTRKKLMKGMFAEEKKGKDKGGVAAVMGGAEKGIGKVASSLGQMLPPLVALLTMFGGFTAFVAGLFMLEKQIKQARRQITGLTLDTGEFASIGSKGVNKLQQATLGYTKTLRLSVEEVQESYSGLAKAGFMLDQFAPKYKKVGAVTKLVKDRFQELYSQAFMSGISFGELTQKAGTLREEFGLTGDRLTDAFVRMKDQAHKAGIATSRYFDRVINASTGMAIYGTKIEDVGSAFSGLARTMRLPEKVATEAAAKMVTGWKDLSSEQQVLTYQTSSYGKKIHGLMQEVRKGGEAGTAATLQLKEMGIDQRTIDELKDIVDPINEALTATRSMKPAEQFKARIEGFARAVTGDMSIDVNAKGGIEAINKAMHGNFMQLEQIGKEFGFTTREDVLALKDLTTSMKRNKEAQEKLAEGFGASSLKDLKKKFEESYPELVEAYNKTGKKFEDATSNQIDEFVMSQKTDFKNLEDVQTDLEVARQKAEDVRETKRLKANTDSVIDALERSIPAMLQKFFLRIEPYFNMMVNFLKKVLSALRKGFKMLLQSLIYLFPGTFGGGAVEKLLSEMELDDAIADMNDGLKSLGEQSSATAKQIKATTDEIAKLEKKGKSLTPQEKKRLEALKKDLVMYKDEKKAIDEKIATNKGYLEATEKGGTKALENVKSMSRFDASAEYVNLLKDLQKATDDAQKEAIIKKAKSVKEEYKGAGGDIEMLKDSLKKFSLEEPPELIGNSPIEAIVKSPLEISGNAATPIPAVENVATAGKADNRTFVININGENPERIRKVVLDTLYSEAGK